MRQAYEKCKRHSRSYCSDLVCKSEEDNTGQMVMNTEGHLATGIGGGMAIDTTDGSISFNMGGINVDTA